MATSLNMVKGYRVAANITQEEMANELGVSDTTYRNMETEMKFTLEQMNKFTQVINRVDPSVKTTDIFFR